MKGENQKEKIYKLLYIEDDDVDVMAFERYFSTPNPSFNCDIATTIDAAFELLKSGVSYDIIISDYQLPDGQAVDILDDIKHIPVIIVTGAGDEQLAVTALKKGAYDYITKDSSLGYLKMLPHTIEKVIAHNEDKLQLRATELRYQRLIESANDIIYECDPFGRFIYVNNLSEKVIGYSPEELMGTSFVEIITPELKKSVTDFYQNQFEQKKTSTYLEFEVLRKDGTKLWVGQNVTTLFDENKNEITGHLGVVRDISLKKKYELRLKSVNIELEQKVEERTNKLSTIATNLTKEIELRHEVEKELRVSGQNYIDLFNNVNEAIIVFDPLTEIVIEANNKAFELYGYSRDEFIGISLAEVSTEMEVGKGYIDEVYFKEKTSTYETTHLDKLGNRIFIEINATKSNYAGEKVILSINRNITARRLIEEQLEIERKRGLSSLIDGQEIERKRLTRDLHDGLGQLLFAIKLYVKKLSNSEKLIEKDKLLVTEIMEMLEMTIVETRQIYQNLLPTSLSDFGIEVALKQIVKVINENSDCEIMYTFQGIATRLDSDLEIGTYRIAQEAINNSHKHSGAAKIWVTLEMTNEKLRLEVKDNGDGFNPNAKSDRTDAQLSHGMNNMKQRAEVLGLELQINSKLNEGTSIVLTKI